MADDTLMTSNGQQWHIKQRSWCVSRFIETKSYKKIRAEFLHEFETDRAPCKSIIQAWMKKFSEFGTVKNLNSKSGDRESHSGRKRKRDEALIDRVRDDVEDSPKRSSRKRCQALGISRSTLLRVIRSDLKQFPYKLSPSDRKQRETMATVLMDKIETNKSFLGLLK